MTLRKAIICFIISGAVAVPAGAAAAIYLYAGLERDTVTTRQFFDMLPGLLLVACFALPLLLIQAVVYWLWGLKSPNRFSGFIIPGAAFVIPVLLKSTGLEIPGEGGELWWFLFFAPSIAALIGWALILALTSRANPRD